MKTLSQVDLEVAVDKICADDQYPSSLTIEEIATMAAELVKTQQTTMSDITRQAHKKERQQRGDLMIVKSRCTSIHNRARKAAVDAINGIVDLFYDEFCRLRIKQKNKDGESSMVRIADADHDAIETIVANVQKNADKQAAAAIEWHQIYNMTRSAMLGGSTFGEALLQLRLFSDESNAAP